MPARWVGALLYAVAAAAAATGTLALDGPLDPRQLRETAPLAAALGGLLGLAVNQRWPQRWDAAMMTGFLTAFVGLVFFSAAYLFGDAVIEAWRGGAAPEAVSAASERLGAHLPVAAGLAAGGFALAGLAMWTLGALGRWAFGSRGEKGETGGAAKKPEGDPGAAGV